MPVRYLRCLLGHNWSASPPAYTYLLGLYLGDGCLTPCPRDVFKLRIACAERYPRYHFSNVSADIRGIFGRACDQLGIEWRPNNPFSLSVARRGSVALLDEFVGPKR